MDPLEARERIYTLLEFIAVGFLARWAWQFSHLNGRSCPSVPTKFRKLVAVRTGATKNLIDRDLLRGRDSNDYRKREIFGEIARLMGRIAFLGIFFQRFLA